MNPDHLGNVTTAILISRNFAICWNFPSHLIHPHPLLITEHVYRCTLRLAALLLKLSRKKCQFCNVLASNKRCSCTSCEVLQQQEVANTSAYINEPWLIINCSNGASFFLPSRKMKVAARFIATGLKKRAPINRQAVKQNFNLFRVSSQTLRFRCVFSEF